MRHRQSIIPGCQGALVDGDAAQIAQGKTFDAQPFVARKTRGAQRMTGDENAGSSLHNGLVPFNRRRGWHRAPGAVPAVYQNFLVKTLQMPARLDRLRVLDIGMYDGFGAFECEKTRRGGSRRDRPEPSTASVFKLAHAAARVTRDIPPDERYELDERARRPLLSRPVPGRRRSLAHILMSFDNLDASSSRQGRSWSRLTSATTISFSATAR